MGSTSEYTTQIHLIGTCPTCLKKIRISEFGELYSHKFQGEECGSVHPIETSNVELIESLSYYRREIEDYEFDIKNKYEPDITKSKHDINVDMVEKISVILNNWKPETLAKKEVQVKRKSSAPPKPRATCPLCGKKIPLRKNGNVSEHGMCWGSEGNGLIPLETNDSELIRQLSDHANKVARIRFRFDHNLITYDENIVLKSARKRLKEIERLRDRQKQYGYDPIPIIVERLKIENGEHVASIKVNHRGYKKPLPNRAVVLPCTKDIDQYGVIIADWPPIEGEPPAPIENCLHSFYNAAPSTATQSSDTTNIDVLQPDNLKRKKSFFQRLFGK